MGKVTELRPKVTADDILSNLGGKLETAVVIGWDNDGSIIMSSNLPDGEMLLLMDIAKVSIVETYFNEYDG